MKIALILLLVHLFSPCFSQAELIRLGTLEDINVTEKATNEQPLLVVQNIVYAIPAECFCNRDASNNSSQRNSGKDDLARNQESRSTDREGDSDDLGRNSSGDQSNRDLGTDFIYREEGDSSADRKSGNDESTRASNVASSGRQSAGDTKGRNQGSAADGRRSGNATDGRNSGGASDDRDSSSDKLGRNFTTVHTIPACARVKESCSIKIFGFHPKVNVKYFDRVESIKAVEMTIEF